MRFTRGDNQFGDLERQLRAERTEPSSQLQGTVSELTSLRTRRPPHAPIRLAVSGALTLTVLVTVAVLGTTSYASNGGASQNGQTKGAAREAPENSSQSQYGEQVIICHRTGKGTKGKTLRLSRQGAKNHLNHHRYDTAGPCR